MSDISDALCCDVDYEWAAFETAKFTRNQARFAFANNYFDYIDTRSRKVFYRPASAADGDGEWEVSEGWYMRCEKAHPEAIECWEVVSVHAALLAAMRDEVEER